MQSLPERLDRLSPLSRSHAHSLIGERSTTSYLEMHGKRAYESGREGEGLQHSGWQTEAAAAAHPQSPAGLFPLPGGDITNLDRLQPKSSVAYVKFARLEAAQSVQIYIGRRG